MAVRNTNVTQADTGGIKPVKNRGIVADKTTSNKNATAMGGTTRSSGMGETGKAAMITDPNSGRSVRAAENRGDYVVGRVSDNSGKVVGSKGNRLGQFNSERKPQRNSANIGTGRIDNPRAKERPIVKPIKERASVKPSLDLMSVYNDVKRSR